MEVGATYREDNSCAFGVWGPYFGEVTLQLYGKGSIAMVRDERGYWHASVGHLESGTNYRFRCDGRELPDPASHFQPEGVHGPSQVIDHLAYNWQDGDWRGCGLEEMVIYELHVGTFTDEGTFAAVEGRLNELWEAGFNAIELMPVAQFPGTRNWGYDGAYAYAVQNSYGGPEGLKHLIDACHVRGMAVLLDVVYNHFGPEGAYICDMGPYLTSKYNTPWGMAINFDDEYSDEVRNFFIQNALYWLRYYHIDGLRLDAVHAIYDSSARPFLLELAVKVGEYSRQSGRKRYLIAESDFNDVRLVRPEERGGMGLDAQWSDDFHHSLHALLTGERQGYYGGYGSIEHIAKAYKEGFVYSWVYSPVRKRHFGSSSAGEPGGHFIVCAQNHDQVGNRMKGERLSSLVNFEAAKLAAAAVILSPYIPLVFMGEEYGEDNPFLYFVDHSDNALIEAVRRGRRQEFAGFGWGDDVPDPQSRETFQKSKLEWGKRFLPKHAAVASMYKELISLRRRIKALRNLDKAGMDVAIQGGALVVRRWRDKSGAMLVLNFKQDMAKLRTTDGQNWIKVFDSASEQWLGPGEAAGQRLAGSEFSVLGYNAVLYEMEIVNG